MWHRSAISSLSGLHRFIPGPAGVLNKEVEDHPLQHYKEHEASGRADAVLSDGERRTLALAQFNDSSAWHAMLEALDLPPYDDAQSRNDRTLLFHSLFQLRQTTNMRTVPVICLLVKEHDKSSGMAVVRDPTEEANAHIDASVLDDFSNFGPGTAMVLRRVEVFSPNAFEHVMVITSSNIVRLFPSSSSRPPRPNHLQQPLSSPSSSVCRIRYMTQSPLLAYVPEARGAKIHPPLADLWFNADLDRALECSPSSQHALPPHGDSDSVDRHLNQQQSSSGRTHNTSHLHHRQYERECHQDDNDPHQPQLHHRAAASHLQQSPALLQKICTSQDVQATALESPARDSLVDTGGETGSLTKVFVQHNDDDFDGLDNLMDCMSDEDDGGDLL